MSEYKSIPFEFEGKEYELRVVSDGFTTRVRAFLGGRPANGYSYSIDFPTAFGFKKKFRIDPVQVLIDDAIRDVKDKAWDRYLEALRADNDKAK